MNYVKTIRTTVILFSFLGLYMAHLAPTIHAKTASASATDLVLPPSPSPTSKTAPDSTSSAMQNIKERVEKVIQTTDPQIKGMIATLKQQKFGIAGTLEKIVGSTLQIRTNRGGLRVAELDHDAVLLKGTKPIAREELELNSPTIIMGFRDGDGTLTVRRLIMSDVSAPETKKITVYGKVESLTTKFLTIRTFAGGQTLPQPIKVTSKTTFFNTLDDTIKRTEVLPLDPVVVVLPDTATASAVRVYSLSPKAVPSPSLLPTQ